MSIEIRILGRNDAHVLEQVAPGVFDCAVDSGLSSEFLADRRHHLAVAVEAGTVIGMASAIDYIHPDKPVELWINEVGVAPSHQRKGIGRRLMNAMFGVADDLGCREIWVAAQAYDHDAQHFYAALGGNPESSVLFAFHRGS